MRTRFIGFVKALKDVAIIANNRCKPGYIKPKRRSNGSASSKYGN
jgi:hypothetical protein